MRGGEVLQDRPLADDESSDDIVLSPDQQELVRSVENDLGRISTVISPGEFSPPPHEVDGIPGTSEFSQSGEDFYKRIVRIENRKPLVDDWSAAIDDLEWFGSR